MSAPKVTAEGDTPARTRSPYASKARSTSPALAQAAMSVVNANRSARRPAAVSSRNARNAASASPAAAHVLSSMLYARTSGGDTRRTKRKASSSRRAAAHACRNSLWRTREATFCTPARLRLSSSSTHSNSPPVRRRLREKGERTVSVDKKSSRAHFVQPESRVKVHVGDLGRQELFVGRKIRKRPGAALTHRRYSRRQRHSPQTSAAQLVRRGRRKAPNERPMCKHVVCSFLCAESDSQRQQPRARRCAPSAMYPISEFRSRLAYYPIFPRAGFYCDDLTFDNLRTGMGGA